MGCWNETCALSGLPIQGGDECYRIVFESDKIDDIAFCAIDEPTKMAKWIQSIELGIYDDYGRLEGTKDLSDIDDTVVFVLKHFWDLAPSKTPEYATKCIEDSIRQADGWKELIAELPAVATMDIAQISTINIMETNRELYIGFVYVAWWMSMLRRTFYTAAYRGGQSYMAPFADMNKSISEYIHKLCESEVD